MAAAAIHKLIVTGDDYGLCAPVNEAIEECLAAGVMRATCVMANMPAHAHAARLRRKFPQSSIGLHWNLTQGMPILGSERVPSLIDGAGRFGSSLQRRWLRRQVKPAEIRAELRAQYEQFCALAGAPDFWNTHQNVHVFPGLFQLFVATARDLEIPAMRCHRRFSVPAGSSVLAHHLRHPGYWLKGQIISLWSKQAERRGAAMPDGRIHTPGYRAGEYGLEEVLRRVRWEKVDAAVELVIHPATRVEGGLFGGLTESRLREYEMFRDPGLAHALGRIGVRPVGFEVLRPAFFPNRKGAAA